MDNTAPAISPNAAQQGNQLTATHGTWTNPDNGYTYAWADCINTTDPTLGSGGSCTTIPSATSPTYTPDVNDIGSYLRVYVTASNNGGSTTAPSSATALVTPAPATNSAAPRIATDASSLYQEGHQLTGTAGTWAEASSAPESYHEVWERCDSYGAGCTAIAGTASTSNTGTSTTYTPARGDVGHTIRVSEYVDNGGTPVPSAVASNATAVIEPSPAVNSGQPTINGTPQQSQPLTEGHGSWSETNGPTSYSYQWEDCDANGANCSAISGATAQTYTPTASDVGDTLVVLEIADNGGRPIPASVSSQPSAVVLPTAPSWCLRRRSPARLSRARS